MAEFWRVGGECVVSGGAPVSLGSTGTYVTAVTVTTTPSGDVVVKVVVISLDVLGGGFVVGGEMVEVVKVVSGTVSHGSMIVFGHDSRER
jgi:hypothetical protein